jgi:hypothetical protein
MLAKLTTTRRNKLKAKAALGVTHPTTIFAQSDVQSVMPAALDHPIAPLELEKVCRIQLLQG